MQWLIQRLTYIYSQDSSIEYLAGELLPPRCIRLHLLTQEKLHFSQKVSVLRF